MEKLPDEIHLPTMKYNNFLGCYDYGINIKMHIIVIWLIKESDLVTA